MPEESKLIVHVFLAEKKEWHTLVLEGYGFDWQRGPGLPTELQKRAAEFVVALAQNGAEARMELAGVPLGGSYNVARAPAIRFPVPDLADVDHGEMPHQIGRAAAAAYHASATQVVFDRETQRLAVLAGIPGDRRL